MTELEQITVKVEKYRQRLLKQSAKTREAEYEKAIREVFAKYPVGIVPMALIHYVLSGLNVSPQNYHQHNREIQDLIGKVCRSKKGWLKLQGNLIILQGVSQ